MPYIDQHNRNLLEPLIAPLVSHLQGINDEDIEGVMNYTITTLATRVMNKPWRYKWINRTVGFLECVKQEFYRRLVSEYEFKCIQRNGDIKEYDI